MWRSTRALPTSGACGESRLSDDLTPERARRLVSHIKTDVERGVWRRTARETGRAADPTFHAWVSDWWDEKRKEALEERTREWYRWAIQGHLLPYCHDRRLSRFDVPYVKQLRSHLRDKRWPTKPYTGPGWETARRMPAGKASRDQAPQSLIRERHPDRAVERPRKRA